MSVVGLDLGNESSVVAVARRRGIDVLQTTLPSMVAFSGRQRLTGSDAIAQFATNYKNSISLFKRLLGVKYDECKDVDLSVLPFNTVKMPNGTIGVEVTYDDKPATMAMEQVVAGMLQCLKAVAEAGLDGQRVVDCVLACPAYWPDERRRAYLDAAHVAGLNVLRVMNETTAVALTYGIYRPLPENEPHKVMFIDVGHMDTKVGVTAFQAGKLQMLSVSSDRNLGVHSFCELLVHHTAKYVLEKYKMDVRPNRKAMIKLRRECAAIMKVLSVNPKAPFNVESIMNGKDVSGEVTRQEFEKMARQSLLSRFAFPIEEALALAGLHKTELHSVEVVGGGVRIPMVQATLTELVGRDLSFTCDGDESVARGCAVMCAMLSPSFKVRDFDVQDLTAYAIDMSYRNLGEIPEDIMELLKQGHFIPCQKVIRFKDRREPIQFDIKYHNPALLPPGTNPLLGRYIVSGVPTDATEPFIVKVRLDVDLHGVAHVSGAEWSQSIASEGLALKVARYNTAGMSQAELKALSEKERAMVNADRAIKDTLDARKAPKSMNQEQDYEQEQDVGLEQAQAQEEDVEQEQAQAQEEDVEQEQAQAQEEDVEQEQAQAQEEDVEQEQAQAQEEDLKNGDESLIQMVQRHFKVPLQQWKEMWPEQGLPGRVLMILLGMILILIMCFYTAFLIVRGALLLRGGATRDDFTHLFAAAEQGRADVVRQLVKEHGAAAVVNNTTQYGTTPLYIAACEGHADVVRLLVKECDAAVNQATQRGTTPLFIAAFEGHADVVRLLVRECGAAVNQATSVGITPLMAASSAGHKQIVNFLVKYGGATAPPAVSAAPTEVNPCSSRSAVLTPDAKVDSVLTNRSAVADILQCGRPGCSTRGTKKCTGCRATRYCSAECQKSHWKAHKAVCRSMQEKKKKKKGSKDAMSSLD